MNLKSVEYPKLKLSFPCLKYPYYLIQNIQGFVILCKFMIMTLLEFGCWVLVLSIRFVVLYMYVPQKKPFYQDLTFCAKLIKLILMVDENVSVKPYVCPPSIATCGDKIQKRVYQITWNFHVLFMSIDVFWLFDLFTF